MGSGEGATCRAAGGHGAAFFDLDKTIIATSSTLAFSRPFFANGLITRGSVIRSMYAQFVYLAAGADHDQIERMRRYLTGLTNGWEVATVRQIVAETLHDVVDPVVYDEALELIRDHQQHGREVVIVSTSGSDVVEPIAELLGVSSVIATRLEVRDGRYTGRDRVLRLRRQQGLGDPGDRRAGGIRPARVLRLQRLGNRPADAQRRRPSAAP